MSKPNCIAFYDCDLKKKCTNQAKYFFKPGKSNVASLSGPDDSDNKDYLNYIGYCEKHYDELVKGGICVLDNRNFIIPICYKDGKIHKKKDNETCGPKKFAAELELDSDDPKYNKFLGKKFNNNFSNFEDSKKYTFTTTLPKEISSSTSDDARSVKSYDSEDSEAESESDEEEEDEEEEKTTALEFIPKEYYNPKAYRPKKMDKGIAREQKKLPNMPPTDNKTFMRALKDIDSTNDIAVVMSRLEFVIDSIELENTNRRRDVTYNFSVSEDVVNKFANLLHNKYKMKDPKRIELLMSFLFDYDSRDLTKKFSEFDLSVEGPNFKGALNNNLAYYYTQSSGAWHSTQPRQTEEALKNLYKARFKKEEIKAIETGGAGGGTSTETTPKKKERTGDGLDGGESGGNIRIGKYSESAGNNKNAFLNLNTILNALGVTQQYSKDTLDAVNKQFTENSDLVSGLQSATKKTRTIPSDKRKPLQDAIKLYMQNLNPDDLKNVTGQFINFQEKEGGGGGGSPRSSRKRR